MSKQLNEPLANPAKISLSEIHSRAVAVECSSWSRILSNRGHINRLLKNHTLTNAFLATINIVALPSLENKRIGLEWVETRTRIQHFHKNMFTCQTRMRWIPFHVLYKTTGWNSTHWNFLFLNSFDIFVNIPKPACLFYWFVEITKIKNFNYIIRWIGREKRAIIREFNTAQKSIWNRFTNTRNPYIMWKT